MDELYKKYAAAYDSDFEVPEEDSDFDEDEEDETEEEETDEEVEGNDAISQTCFSDHLSQAITCIYDLNFNFSSQCISY